ncbi:VasL domain-containing protein [Pantoea sp. KPR_PJ]|uniref:VasL domain-containing protein n=1 Tax=Pantoea sp. KPR_PJ TaxID=2738375 RepID=UPI003529B378
MNDITTRKITAGGDPRTLPDFTAIQHELKKLMHPARPDVNWRYAEERCLSLFHQNGVDLQSAAWYTLARTHLAGLSGLNQGLAMLETLVRHQWSKVWPQPVHARMRILSSLSQRLQQWMRSLPLTKSDIAQLYQAERILTALGEVPGCLELKHLSQIETLRALMHNRAVWLEGSDGLASPAGPTQQDKVMPHAEASAGLQVAGFSGDNRLSGKSATKGYRAQPERQTKREVVKPAAIATWKSFLAGMGAMLVISMFAVGSWHALHRPDPLKMQLVASLAPLPVPLTPEQLETLHQHYPSLPSLITQTHQQLGRLNKLPPDWALLYGQKLTEQAQRLWPEQANALRQQWQQQLDASALPTEQLNGWSQGMLTLQQLSDRLSELDKQKGKYMTVSELKSVIFSAREFFIHAIPAEEQLRLLSQTPADEPLPVAAIAQLEMHLKQLAARYVDIKQRASE